MEINIDFDRFMIGLGLRSRRTGEKLSIRLGDPTGSLFLIPCTSVFLGRDVVFRHMFRENEGEGDLIHGAKSN